MTPQRFRSLVQGYGGDIARWPRDAQAEARRLLTLSPALQTLIEEELDLDRRLDAWPLPRSPSPSLSARVLAAAPDRRTAVVARWTRWLPGAGMVGALGLGAVAGAALMLTAGPPPSPGEGWSSLYDQSSFGDLAQLDAPQHPGAGG